MNFKINKKDIVSAPAIYSILFTAMIYSSLPSSLSFMTVDFEVFTFPTLLLLAVLPTFQLIELLWKVSIIKKAGSSEELTQENENLGYTIMFVQGVLFSSLQVLCVYKLLYIDMPFVSSVSMLIGIYLITLGIQNGKISANNKIGILTNFTTQNTKNWDTVHSATKFILMGCGFAILAIGPFVSNILFPLLAIFASLVLPLAYNYFLQFRLIPTAIEKPTGTI